MLFNVVINDLQQRDRAEADRQAKEARERATEARQSANAARPAFRGFQRSTETRPSGGFGTAFGVGPGTPPPAHLPARSDARLESNDAEIKELREELDRLRREVEDLRRVATRQER